MCDVQPDGDVHGPRDQVSPTLKVTKSAQEPRQSNQFPKLPTSLSGWSPQLALRDKSQSPEFTVGIDAKRTFVDKRSRPNLQRMRPNADISAGLAAGEIDLSLSSLTQG